MFLLVFRFLKLSYSVLIIVSASQTVSPNGAINSKRSHWDKVLRGAMTVAKTHQRIRPTFNLKILVSRWSGLVSDVASPHWGD